MRIFGRNENFICRIIIRQLFFSNRKKLFKVVCKNVSLNSIEKKLFQAMLLSNGSVMMYVTEKELLNLMSIERKYNKVLTMDRDAYCDRDVGTPNRKMR